MDYIKRKPSLVVGIVRPNYNSDTYSAELVVQFVPYNVKDKKRSTALIAYEFSESLAAVESNFSLTLTPEVDENGMTWMDKLEKMDIVYITEWGRVRFCGYVEDIRFSARMTGDGKPGRVILVEGGSVGKLLSTFKIILNQAMLPGIGTAKSKSDTLNGILQALIAKGESVKGVFGEIYKDFMELMFAIGQSENIQNQGIYALLNYFIDYEKGISKNIKAIYPMNLSLYNVGENNVWNILSNLAFPPINELFGIWHINSGKYKIIFRQSPFEPKDWNLLPLTIIPAVALTSYDLGTSTSEAFTFYQAGLPGYPLNDNEAKLLGNYVIDKKKWVKYGYKPMYVQFKYFDKGELKDGTDITIQKIMKGICEMLKRWYEHNDEFLSGTAKFMTFDDTKPWPGKNFIVRNPRIGERIGVFDVQFYVESIAHSWTYGGPMETTVQMTRGYRYDSEGKMIGKVDKIGTKLISMKDFDSYWAGQLKWK